MSKNKHVYIDPDTHAAIKAEAGRRRVTVQELVRELLRSELGRRQIPVETK